MNELSWGFQYNYSGIFLNGHRVDVKETDYLGLYSDAITTADIAYALGAVAMGMLVFSLYRERRKRRRLEEILRSDAGDQRYYVFFPRVSARILT